MTTQERIDACHPNVRPYFERLRDALADAIVIPNNLLPENLRQYHQYDSGKIGPDVELSPDDLEFLSEDEHTHVGLDSRVYGRTIADLQRRL